MTNIRYDPILSLVSQILMLGRSHKPIGPTQHPEVSRTNFGNRQDRCDQSVTIASSGTNTTITRPKGNNHQSWNQSGQTLRVTQCIRDLVDLNKIVQKELEYK